MNLKQALRVCAAFRGCYLDFRDKAEGIVKSQREALQHGDTQEQYGWVCVCVLWEGGRGGNRGVQEIIGRRIPICCNTPPSHSTPPPHSPLSHTPLLIHTSVAPPPHTPSLTPPQHGVFPLALSSRGPSWPPGPPEILPSSDPSMPSWKGATIYWSWCRLCWTSGKGVMVT